MEKKLVITGLTGKKSGGAFLRLLSSHWDEISIRYPGGIRALVRTSSDPSEIRKLVPDTEICAGDFADPIFLDRTLDGADTLLHIAGINLSPALTESAARCGLRRLILVHTTGIYSKYKAAGAEYRKIDRQVEEICRQFHIVLTVLRPTMIYGNLSDNNICFFLRMVDKLPLMPVVRGARFDLQPVWYGDLADAYLAVLLNEEKTAGKCYDLSGGSPIQLRDLLSELGRQLGKKQVRYVNCPYPVAYGGAVCLYGLSLGRIDLREKIQRLCEPRAYSHEAAALDFGYAPKDFAEGVQDEVQEYLNRKRSAEA